MATDTYKKGQLHRMLQIPDGTKIPFTLLEVIRKAEIGTVVENPTKTGKKEVKVTKLLKQRAVRALTFKRIQQKGQKDKPPAQAKIGDRRENRVVRKHTGKWLMSLPADERKNVVTNARRHLTPQELKEYQKLTHPDFDPYDDPRDLETLCRRREALERVVRSGIYEEYRRSKGYNPDYYNQPYGKRGKQTQSRR